MLHPRRCRWSCLTLLVLVGCQPPMGEGIADDQGIGQDHHFVELRLESFDPTLLDGTATIRASVYYTECLSAFYRDSPEWGYAGAEGKEVFELAIEERLCPELDPSVAECDVVGIRQDFGGDDQLVIQFDNHGTLLDRILRIGPLPTPQLAGCEEGQPAFVGHVSLLGTAESGDNLWVTSSLALVPSEQDRPAEVSVTAP